MKVDVDDGKMQIELCVRLYRPSSRDAENGFADGGRLTKFLLNAKLNAKVQVSGPYGPVRYLGGGFFRIGAMLEPRRFTRIGAIAGGSGIAPIAMVLRAL